jgi:phosphotransferase system HPr (HPr) family protein
MIEVSITVRDALHARPASRVSRCAAQFSAETVLVAGDRSGNAKSVLSLMALDVEAGSSVALRATGADAEAAIDALSRILEGAPEDG